MAHTVLIRRGSMAMIDALFNQTNYVATKRMLDATALRHEAIASNIANLETPGYKRIDLNTSFTEQLNRALTSGDPAALNQVQAALAVDTSAVSGERDGNNVQLENELMLLNQNTLAHTVETQLITGNLLKLRLAVTGRSA